MAGEEGNDSELEEYYQELGIEPADMKKKVDEEALYKKKKKKEAKKQKVE